MGSTVDIVSVRVGWTVDLLVVSVTVSEWVSVTVLARWNYRTIGHHVAVVI